MRRHAKISRPSINFSTLLFKSPKWSNAVLFLPYYWCHIIARGARLNYSLYRKLKIQNMNILGKYFSQVSIVTKTCVINQRFYWFPTNILSLIKFLSHLSIFPWYWSGAVFTTRSTHKSFRLRHFLNTLPKLREGVGLTPLLWMTCFF